MIPASPIDILAHTRCSEYDTVKQLHERHYDDFIELTIYRRNNLFAYGYKLKISRIIRQKTPHQTAFTHPSITAALSAAKHDIQKQCSISRNAKKALLQFTVIQYNQLELFTEE